MVKVFENILLNMIKNQQSSGQAPAPNLFFLVILLVIPVGLFFYIKKKKKDKENEIPKGRHEGDEVWKTVKDFLKNNGEIGKEIIETYVAKRPDENIVDKTLPKEKQLEQKKEIKLRKLKLKEENKKLKAEGKLAKQEKQRDLYVVLFRARNSKTNIEDVPRVIECEVKMIKKGKYETERKILTLGERDYEVESKWILPIKEAEELKYKKELEKQEKIRKKRDEKIQKKKQKKSSKKPK